MEKPDGTSLGEAGWQPPDPDAVQSVRQRHFDITAEADYKGPMIINIWDEYEPAVAPKITATIAAPAMTPTPTIKPEATPVPTPTAIPTATPIPTPTPTPDPQCHMEEGMRLHGEGRYQEAMDQFSQARIITGTTSPELELWNGKAHRGLGNFEKALKHLHIAVYLADNAVHRAERANLYLDMGNLEEALSDGYAARNKADMEWEGYHSRAEGNLVIARAWARLERWDEAVQHLEEAMTIAKEHGYPENRTAEMQALLDEARARSNG